MCNLFPHVHINVLYPSIYRECLVDGNSEANIFIFSPYCFCIDIEKSKKKFIFILFFYFKTALVWLVRMYFSIKNHKYMELNSFWCIIFILNFFRFGISAINVYVTHTSYSYINVYIKTFQFDLVPIIVKAKTFDCRQLS